MSRDQAYQAYLKEHPNGNFARFAQLSQAGKRSYSDPTAVKRDAPPLLAPLPRGVEPLAPVGPTTPRRGRDPSSSKDHAPGKELRRKIAWAVGSVYGVKYIHYDTWPADYARRATERLIEIHGEP